MRALYCTHSEIRATGDGRDKCDECGEVFPRLSGTSFEDVARIHPHGGCVCADGTCAYCRSVKAEARVQAVIDAIEVTWPRVEPERVVAYAPVLELARAVRLPSEAEEYEIVMARRRMWPGGW